MRVAAGPLGDQAGRPFVIIEQVTGRRLGDERLHERVRLTVAGVR